MNWYVKIQQWRYCIRSKVKEYFPLPSILLGSPRPTLDCWLPFGRRLGSNQRRWTLAKLAQQGTFRRSTLSQQLDGEEKAILRWKSSHVGESDVWSTVHRQRSPFPSGNTLIRDTKIANYLEINQYSQTGCIHIPCYKRMLTILNLSFERTTCLCDTPDPSSYY